MLEAAQRSLAGRAAGDARAAGRSSARRSSRRSRTSTPATSRPTSPRGAKYGYLLLWVDPRREPDGDADPVDEREARHRNRQNLPRGVPRALLGRRCASCSGCRPRWSRWRPTSRSSSARRSASTCSSASRCFPPGCSPGVAAFVILAAAARGFRRLEAVIAVLVGVIVVGFAFQMFLAEPDGGASREGLLTPRLRRHRERAARGRHPRRDGDAARHLPALGADAAPRRRRRPPSERGGSSASSWSTS